MMPLSLLYFISALLLALYTLGHGALLLQYGRYRRQSSPRIVTPQDWPQVTIQLPVYNERAVALRLLDAVAALDYPAEKLQIQLLDDSDDGTSHLLAAALRRYPRLNIAHIRRGTRSGYKAGALEQGLAHTDAPFVAIFDADFVPPPDFLRRTVPHLLAQDDLALVQTRWEHLNPDDNWLTKAQRLAVDLHFTIEQRARSASGWFVPFNGTGGVWRTAAIRDAGGWSARTLTEDLDLSFRAQLKGWRALYLPQVAVPGELPPRLSAYRQQQARWARGSAQCLRQLTGAVWRSDASWMTRLLATHHLAQYIPHLLMLLIQIVTPLLLLTGQLPGGTLAPLGIISLIPLVMIVFSQFDLRGGWRGLIAFPALLLLGTGLAAHHARAVVNGLLTDAGEFRRTPKYGAGQIVASIMTAPLLTAFEIALGLYSLWGAWLASQTEPALLPYLALNGIAYLTVAIWDLREQRDGSRRREAARLLADSGSD